MNKRPTNRYAKNLRTPKYKMRVKPNKKKPGYILDKYSKMSVLEQLATIEHPGLAE